MNNNEILDAIKVLTAVVNANSGILGDSRAYDMANEKIKELIILINSNPLNQ